MTPTWYLLIILANIISSLITSITLTLGYALGRNWIDKKIGKPALKEPGKTGALV